MKTRVLRMTKTVRVFRIAEILHDMRSEMTDEELMIRHKLGWTELKKVYTKLFYGGYLTSEDMRRRMEMRTDKDSAHIPFAEIEAERMYECGTCGYTTELHFSECPRCKQLNLRRLRRSSLFANFYGPPAGA